MDDHTLASTDGLGPAANGPTPLPYGSWPSPIRIDDLVGESVTLGDPWIDGDDTFWIESRPGQGTTVFVALPLRARTADQVAGPANAGAAGASAA